MEQTKQELVKIARWGGGGGYSHIMCRQEIIIALRWGMVFPFVIFFNGLSLVWFRPRKGYHVIL